MQFFIGDSQIASLVPVLAAFLISVVTAPAGVSGAFLLLPFQMSVLHLISPAVSPTNLIYNLLAAPGGVARYWKEGRMAWPLIGILTVGTLPGVIGGAWIRIVYLPDPRLFKFVTGWILLYLAGRLLPQVLRPNERQPPVRSLHHPTAIQTRLVNIARAEIIFEERTYSFNPLVLAGVSLGVGIIGGIYGIGGGAILAPFCTAVLGLPVYIVAGAALASTFLTSAVGVGFYSYLATVATINREAVVPDWKLGLLFGLGGLAGSYLGGTLQKWLPERLIQTVLLLLVLALAFSYLGQFFFT